MSAPRMVTVLAISTAAVLGSAAPDALASRTQTSVFEDDHLLLNSGSAVRDKTLDEVRALGADTIHTLVMWDRIAPEPESVSKPAFDAADPNAYGNWSPWDELVQAAQARGLKLLLTPTGRAPAWASECSGPVARRKTCSPRVADYADFVHAVGARYPTVTMWSFWNEPNHASWLKPQTGRRAGVKVNEAAIRYRLLVKAGLRALGQTGHADDLRLIGETAPLGSNHSTAPVDFYRELFCLDRDYRPFRGAAAKARRCSPRPHFAIDGVSHHPYTFAGVAKPSVTGRPGDAPIGALGRVTKVLDGAARFGIVPRGTPVYLTEFGYQTRPPDPFGVSLAEQARYINLADYIAFINPRIASVAQYTLRDDPAQAGFNTGLRFANGRAKPSLAAYALPLYVLKTHSGHGRIFGQVRAAGGTPATVQVQHRKGKTGPFATLAEVQTNVRGYFLQRFPRIAGQWRLKYAPGDAAGRARYSRVAAAA
ncbi:MAG: hypothetical protein QOJ29_1815 [Thermoleophilaceae bacterium]|nr:hypothetical protein [Thermoleophilaceae bacterium]